MNTIRYYVLLLLMFCFMSCHTQEMDVVKPMLRVPCVSRTEVEAADVPALLDAAEVPFQTIASVNWSAFPYQPQARFRVGHTDSAILVHYQVDEDCVAALATDGGAVFKDACCEFFIAPADDGIYYNFETNCAGFLLMEAGTGKGALRSAAPDEMFTKVKRWASLGHETFELRNEPTHWELALVIPVEVFYRHHITSLSGRIMRANFYKCGNALCQRHYLSWCPINTPAPDFHQPDFFGTIFFIPI